MKQETLAEQMGVTRGNVSGWENGRHEPSFSQIKRIAQICEADLAPLFEGTSFALPIVVKQAAGWPFTVDFKLYVLMDQEEKSRLDDDVTHAVERWHKKNPIKSAKAS